MKMITLRLGKNRHPIWVGPKSLDRVGQMMKKNGVKGKVMVVTNPVVGQLYGARLRKSLAVAGIRSNWFEIPDAETSKSLVWCGRAYRAMAQAGMDRGDCVVALGGGVVGDLGGFLGATYLRGIVTVQVPTSLIAQVDSSVGGKTGVNLPEGKNLVGAFCQPDLVVIDPTVLGTLPEREWKSGMAEIVKYGVIAKEAFFHFVENHLEGLRKFRPKDLNDAVLTSCRIKAMVVEADEREAGPRAILNFGHTFGHALEVLTRYRRYTHGEAIGMGMAWAARLSVHQGLCRQEDSDRLVNLLRGIGLPIDLPRINRTRLLEAMIHDKKVRGGKLRFVLMRRIGDVGVYDDIPEDAIFETAHG